MSLPVACARDYAPSPQAKEHDDELLNLQSVGDLAVPPSTEQPEVSAVRVLPAGSEEDWSLQVPLPP